MQRAIILISFVLATVTHASPEVELRAIYPTDSPVSIGDLSLEGDSLLIPATGGPGVDRFTIEVIVFAPGEKCGRLLMLASDGVEILRVDRSEFEISAGDRVFVTVAWAGLGESVWVQDSGTYRKAVEAEVAGDSQENTLFGSIRSDVGPEDVSLNECERWCINSAIKCENRCQCGIAYWDCTCTEGTLGYTCQCLQCEI